MWFEKLMGFQEESHLQVQNNIILGEKTITSKVNGKTYRFGSLGVPSLSEMKDGIKISDFKGKAHISQYIGDVQDMHQDPNNTNALFQVASQFNLLEMSGPMKTPEMGVDIYDFDYTQGPACAIACGAGTIYRNYFMPVNGRYDRRGQYEDLQINCLSDIDNALNVGRKPWNMVNGYALLTKQDLEDVNYIFEELGQEAVSHLKDKLRVGIQWNAQVTLNDCDHNVSQVFCSAMPVAYSHVDSDLWAPLATLVLEGTYEATLYAALMNLKFNSSNKVFLTLVGGGAFGNSMEWIAIALINVLRKFKDTPLDIRIVSHEKFNPIVNEIIKAVWE